MLKFIVFPLLLMAGCGASEYRLDLKEDSPPAEEAVQIVCDPQGTPFGYGSGTDDNPFLICTKQQFLNIRLDPYYADKSFKQTEDIDFGNDVLPQIIGFIGKYDGNGKKLSNLQSVGGLFKTLTLGASVSDLIIDTATITCTEASAGVLVGTANDDVSITDVTVKNSSVTCTTFNDVGGIIGYSFSNVGFTNTFKRLTAENITINGKNNVGGIAGTLRGYQMQTEDLTSSGSVTGISTVGGIVGYSSGDGSVEKIWNNFSSSASLRGTSYAIGGLVGSFQRAIRLTNSSATGAINCTGGGYMCGGLIGLAQSDGNNLRSPTIENCWSTGNVTGASNSAGGLIGGTSWNGGATGVAKVFVKESFARGNVTATGSYAGGLIGGPNQFMGNCSVAHIENSFATGNISAANYVGGLVGSNCGSIKNSFYSPSDNSINNLTATTNFVGGIVGQNIDKLTAGSLFIPSIQYSISYADKISSPGANKKALVGMTAGTGGYAVIWTYYYLGTTIPVDAMGTSRTQLLMEDDSAATGWPSLGFDFTTIWVKPTANHFSPIMHPVHQWFCDSNQIGVACL